MNERIRNLTPNLPMIYWKIMKIQYSYGFKRQVYLSTARCFLLDEGRISCADECDFFFDDSVEFEEDRILELE